VRNVNNLQSFPWAEENISDNFGTTGCNTPSDSSIFGSLFLAYSLLVNILEDFIKAELSTSL
jgi:hypothetical protein